MTFTKDFLSLYGMDVREHLSLQQKAVCDCRGDPNDPEDKDHLSHCIKYYRVSDVLEAVDAFETFLIEDIQAKKANDAVIVSCILIKFREVFGK